MRKILCAAAVSVISTSTALAQVSSANPPAPPPPPPPPVTPSTCWTEYKDMVKDCDRTFQNQAARQACYDASHSYFVWCLGQVPGSRNPGVPRNETFGNPVEVTFSAGKATRFEVYYAEVGQDLTYLPKAVTKVESEPDKTTLRMELGQKPGEGVLVVRMLAGGKDWDVTAVAVATYEEADLTQDFQVDYSDAEAAFENFGLTGDDEALKRFFDAFSASW